MIEQKLEALTAAIVALTAAITNTEPAAAVANATKAETARGPGRPRSTPAPAATPAAPATVAATPAATAPVAEEAYAEVKKALLVAAEAKGRDTVVKILASFGVTSGKDLKPEQYADAKAAFEAAVKVEAPLA